MNGPCFVTGQHVIDLTEFGYNDTSTLVGHFVSQRKGEEKLEIVKEMKERDRGERKMNESEETEEIKAFPSTFTCCKDSRPCPAISQYQLHDSFASPQQMVFGTPIRKFMLDLEVCVCVCFFFFFFFFFCLFVFLLNSANVLIQQ